MTTTYRIVAADCTTVTLATRADLDAWIARAGLEVTGAMPARSRGVLAVEHRPWIVGQPRIRGVNGPMADYEGVARYEIPAVAAGDTTSPAARATAALAA